MPSGLLIFVIIIVISSFFSAFGKKTRVNMPAKQNNPVEEAKPVHIDNINGSRGPSVQHETPEAGYVVLNGVKRKLEDCKYL